MNSFKVISLLGIVVPIISQYQILQNRCRDRMRFVCRIDCNFFFCARNLIRYILFVCSVICLVDGGADTHKEHAFTGEADIDVTDDGEEDVESVLMFVNISAFFSSCLIKS